MTLTRLLQRIDIQVTLLPRAQALPLPLIGLYCLQKPEAESTVFLEWRMVLFEWRASIVIRCFWELVCLERVPSWHKETLGKHCVGGHFDKSGVILEKWVLETNPLLNMWSLPYYHESPLPPLLCFVKTNKQTNKTTTRYDIEGRGSLSGPMLRHPPEI
jgi:hypothetical protein